MKTLPALIASICLGAFALPASAAVLVADSGWHDDTLFAANAPTAQSPWTFDLTGPGVFRVTDDFVPGDSISLYDGAVLLATSVFEAKSSLGTGIYNDAWASAAYSKIEYFLGAGSYAFTITGDGAGGLPAGFGVRLDTLTSAVPEPATWAMLIVGFGLMGATLRTARRRQTAISYL